MRELSINAKPTNNKAKTVFFILLILSAFDVGAYMLLRRFEVPKSGLVGFLAIGLITGAVLIYTKYVSPKYYYDITEDSCGTPVFVVRQVIGKRHSTICRIGLAEIQRIDRETREQRRAHKTPFSYRKYVYLPTMSPSITYRLTTVSRYEKAEILIEITDEAASYLSEFVREAKEKEAIREAEDEY